MHIHILGICGTFMGGLAVLARAAGHRVTGCDAGVYPPMSAQLEAQGIELIEGWDPKQVEFRPDLFVIGNVVSRGNPLMEAILDAGLRYASGPQWLADHVLAGRQVMAVAGTHGKTTTTSMLAWILEHAGLAPGFLIGGVPNDFGVSARMTGSPYFVIEADEYDTAFFDKRSKFVHYRPRAAILNNLEFDHADIFPDLAAIETQFHQLVRTVPSQGLLVVNAESEALGRVLARGSWSRIERFADPAGWVVRTSDAGFEVVHEGEVTGRVAWALQGEHNAANGLAALLAARDAGVALEQGCAALAAFQGVKRRMEVRGTVDGVTVYDDFAHHPTAIALTIAGLRTKLAADGAKSRIVAVVEPRSNTMKLGTMKAALPVSLAGADRVFGYGAKSGKDALGWNLGDALAPLNQIGGSKTAAEEGSKALVFDDLEQLVAAIVIAARPGDHVLVMSNGGFGGIHERLITALTLRAARKDSTR